MSNQIIPPPDSQIKLQGVTTPQGVQQAMKKVIQEAQYSPEVQQVAAAIMRSCPPDNWPQAVACFAYDVAFFEPDTPKAQTIKTPRRTMEDARANCVDYTVLIGSICAAMGLPVTIRIVQFQGAKNYGHVFPVVAGVPLDVVPGQDQTGIEYRTRKYDAPYMLGIEVPYLRSKDLIV